MFFKHVWLLAGFVLPFRGLDCIGLTLPSFLGICFVLEGSGSDKVALQVTSPDLTLPCFIRFGGFGRFHVMWVCQQRSNLPCTFTGNLPCTLDGNQQCCTQINVQKLSCFLCFGTFVSLVLLSLSFCSTSSPVFVCWWYYLRQFYWLFCVGLLVAKGHKTRVFNNVIL